MVNEHPLQVHLVILLDDMMSWEYGGLTVSSDVLLFEVLLGV